MIPSLLIITIFAILFMVYTYKELGVSGIFVYLSFLWWIFWDILAIITISGFFPPGFKTQSVILLFFLGLYLGIKFKNQIFIKPFVKLSNWKKNEIALESFLFKVILLFMTPVLSFFLIRTLYLLNTKFSQVEYRAEVFGLITGSSELFFNNNLLSFLYWNTMEPLLWTTLIIGCLYSIKYQKNRILIVSFAFFIMHSISTVGRFGFHYCILTIFTLVMIKFIIKRINLNKRIFLTIISSIIILIILILVIRPGNSIQYFIDTYLIGYHTLSFSLLDHELNNPKSIIFDRTLGSSFWTGILNIPSYIATRLGFGWIHEGDIIGTYLHENKLLGFNLNGIPFYHNAFGTIFFSMYRDGGLLGILIYGLFFGYIFALTSKGLRNYNLNYLLISLTLYYILIYGIFQPFTMGPILPAFILSLILINLPLNLNKN